MLAAWVRMLVVVALKASMSRLVVFVIKLGKCF